MDAESSAEALAAAFGLGPLAGPMVAVGRGAMGRVWRMSTASGEWALKELFPWAGHGDREVAFRFQVAAAAAGVRAPRPVRSHDGQIVVEVADTRWEAAEWLDFGPPIEMPPDPATAGRIGALLARLHRLALPVSGEVGAWLTRFPSREDWADLAAAAASAGVPWAHLLDAAIPALVDAGTIAATSAREPLILCHRDLVPGNVRSTPDGDLAVIDWEHAGPDQANWELGYVLSHWTPATGPAARALLAGYRAESGAEMTLNLGMFAAAVCAGQNWTLGRARQALFGPAEDREAASLEAGRSLAEPLTRERLQALLDALGSR